MVLGAPLPHFEAPLVSSWAPQTLYERPQHSFERPYWELLLLSAQVVFLTQAPQQFNSQDLEEFWRYEDQEPWDLKLVIC